MAQKTLIAIAGAVASVAMLGLGYGLGNSARQPVEAVAAAPAGDAEFGEKVRSYLLENPEVLFEVQEAYNTRRESEEKERQVAAISERSDAIFNASTDAIIGNPQGKTTIVEFFDYNCGYCKRAMADMMALTESDPELRFVLKGFPILGPDSHGAHVVSEALKAIRPDVYSEFHQQLLSGGAKANEERAMSVALSLGADEAALREAMKAPQVEANFAETYALADALGITGTPSYVLADEVVFGAQGADLLSEKLANVRTCGSTVC